MAKKVVTPNRFAIELQSRVRRRLRRYTPENPAMRLAFNEIGILMTAEMRRNIKKKDIRLSNDLWLSIGYNIFKRGKEMGVEVGSRGIPYARINEFGSRNFTPQMRRAMMANLRRSGRLLGPQASKNVIRGNVYRARPYIRPAMKKHRKRIKKILQGLIRNGN
jgi:hypothetical protein